MHFQAIAQENMEISNGPTVKDVPGNQESYKGPPITLATPGVGAGNALIFFTIFFSWARMFAFDSTDRDNHSLASELPSILSITIYVQPWCTKAQWTFGTGMDGCLATNWRVYASEIWTRDPYLTHNRSVRNRSSPRRGRKCLRALMAARTAKRRRGVLLMANVMNGDCWSCFGGIIYRARHAVNVRRAARVSMSLSTHLSLLTHAIN